MAPRAVTSASASVLLGRSLVQGCPADHNEPVCSGFTLVRLDKCMLATAGGSNDLLSHPALEPYLETLDLTGSDMTLGPWASPSQPENPGRPVQGGQAGNWKRSIIDVEALS